MKKFLVLALMLGVLFFGYGTSQARVGVADDVPGADVVIPFMCEKGGTFNTLWAVGEVSGAAQTADILVYDIRSTLVYDDEEEWTPRDIVAGNCQDLIAGMSDMQKAALEVTFAGKTYYAGYLIYYNDFPNRNVFVPWVYLVDLPKGFASGFNGYAAEGFVQIEDLPGRPRGLQENGVPITASAMFPRYLILNDKPETATWWIILKGANSPGGANSHRMEGFMCNEEEKCISLKIQLPNELNIINVGPHVPAILHTDFPKAGFGVFAMLPYVPGTGGGFDFADFTTLGWSYQRAQGSSVAGTWDVIHPIHRIYEPPIEEEAP